MKQTVIAELSEMDLNHLIAKIQITKGKILIRPRNAFATADFIRRYEKRGFEYPFEIDIEEMLGSAK